MVVVTHSLLRAIALCMVSAHLTVAYRRYRYSLPFENQQFGNLFTDKHLRNETLLDITDYEPIVFSNQPLAPHNYDVYGRPEDWAIEEEYKGYEVKSDGLPIKTQTVRFKNGRSRAVRIRIGKIGSARYVEGKYRKRVLEIKITSWDREHKFRIKVPLGMDANELKIMEGSKYIDIYAPASLYE